MFSLFPLSGSASSIRWWAATAVYRLAACGLSGCGQTTTFSCAMLGCDEWRSVVQLPVGVDCLKGNGREQTSPRASTVPLSLTANASLLGLNRCRVLNGQPHR